jgi:hypothetical protein
LLTWLKKQIGKRSGPQFGKTNINKLVQYTAGRKAEVFCLVWTRTYTYCYFNAFIDVPVFYI